MSDVQKLFEGHGFSSALDSFSTDLGASFKKRFEEYAKERKPSLRLSNYGKPLRQLWYEVKGITPDSSLPANAKFKFLYGDLIESLVLLLAHEAGYAVIDQQREVEVDGVKGHIDCIIEGVLVDVKSASTFSFNKFKSGLIRQDDPFGYCLQLSAYSKALGGLEGAFLVVDKTLGNIHLERFSREELAQYDVSKRIAEDREALAKDIPPERCYEPVPFQKAGNEKLSIGCSYCAWKFSCWKDANNGEGLKTYQYSNGPVFLTKVVKEPRVEKLDLSFDAKEQ